MCYPPAIYIPSKSVWIRSWYWFRNPGSRPWSRLPPKSKDWSLGHAPLFQKISSKSVHILLRHTAKYQFTSYLLMVKNPGKWSRIHHPRKNSDRHQNQWFARTFSVLSTCQIWWWCAQWLLCYLADTTVYRTADRFTHVDGDYMLAWVTNERTSCTIWCKWMNEWMHECIYFRHKPISGRLGGVVVRASDLGSKDREFDSRPVHCRVA